jgi:hypothetical protein
MNNSVYSNPHYFSVETVQLRSHALTCVGIESDSDYIHSKGYRPPDWENQIYREMGKASMVFVEYFPPEIAQNVYKIPIIGFYAENYVENNMLVYSRIADRAAETGQSIAVADIANRFRFLPFECLPANLPHVMHKTGTYDVKISAKEQAKPSVNDARRVYTARGILQVAASMSDASPQMYVAAPAHVRRVKKYATATPTEESEQIFSRYQRKYHMLDRRVRIFGFHKGKWMLDDAVPII